MSTRRLDNTDLDNLEAAAHGRTGVGVLAHPVDVLRLVAEVRYYKAWMDCVAKVTGYDPRVVCQVAEQVNYEPEVHDVRELPKFNYGDRVVCRTGTWCEGLVGTVRAVNVTSSDGIYGHQVVLDGQQGYTIVASDQLEHLEDKSVVVNDTPPTAKIRKVPDVPKVFTTGAPDRLNNESK